MAQEIATPHAHLSWLRTPLNELLETASTALQSAARDDADEGLLDQARSALQQLGATLRLLDLPGAAMTAGEMRDTVEHVIKQSLPAGSGRADTIDRLLGGTVILHDYLDHLESGSADQSVALLPLLNDLRAIRGARLISEGRYFLPDLNRAEPELDLPEPPSEAPSLTELQRSWQAGLRDWMRNRNRDAALRSLSEVACALRATAGNDAERRMWLFVQALLSAVGDGAIEDNISLRRCLARLDLFIGRRLHDRDTEDPDQLSRSLLFLVAVAGVETGPGRALIEHYRLEHILKAGAWEQAQGSTRGRNTELMHDAADAAADELRSVKTGLNDQIDAPDPEALGAMSEALQSLAYSLDLLAMERPVRMVREQAERLAGLQTDPDANSEESLLDIAEQLVAVEMELKSSGQPAARRTANENATPGDRELQQARLELYAQVVRGLDHAQQELDRMVRGESEGGLETVLTRLQSAAGALRLAQAETAASALDSARNYLEALPSPVERHAADGAMDEFATILATIEQYVIALRDRQRPDEQVVADAAERAARLATGVAIESAQAHASGRVTGDAASEPCDAEPEAADPEEATDGDLDLRYWAPSGTDRSHNPQHEGEEEEPGWPLSGDDGHGLDKPAASGEARPEPALTETTPNVDQTIDETDLNQVLSDEIGELIDTLRATLPAWSQDPEDRESLTSIRRCFHTLKGSAGTMGADTVREFGWRLENLLNEALEGRREPATTVAPVAEAVQVLPSVRDSIAAGDLDKLPASAQSVLEGIDALESQPKAGNATATASDDKAPDTGFTAGPGPTGPPRPEFVDDSAPEPESRHGGEATTPTDEALEAAPAAGPDAKEPDLPDDPFGSSFGAEAATPTDWWRDAPSVTEPGTSEPTQPPDRADTASRRRTDETTERRETGPAVAPGAEELLQASEAQPGDEQPQTTVASDDNKLLTLIADELGEHLDVLEAYLQRSDARGWAEIPDALVLRAVHTSASTTSLSPISSEPEALRAVEHYLQHLHDQELPPPPTGLELMRRAAELIHARIDAQKPGARPYRAELDRELLAHARALLADTVETGADESAEDEAPPTEPRKASSASPQPGESQAPNSTGTEAPTPSGAVVPVDYAAMDADVLEVFLDESGEVLPQIDAAMDEWRESQSADAASSLRRSLHTLKGSARMSGLTAIGDLSHELESLMDSLVGGQVDEQAIETLQHGCDQLHAMVEAASARQPLPAPEIASWRPAPRTPTSASETRTQSEPRVTDTSDTQAPAAPAASRRDTSADATGATMASTLPRERLRVDSELIDRLSNAAGEVSIFRSRLEQQINEMNTHITEVARTITRLREQLRQMDMETEAQIISRHQHDETLDPQFDPLELDRYSKIQQLSRALTESVSDLTNLQEMLDNSAKQSETILLQQSRINTDLQEGLLETRMVPFNSLAPRLRQLVRNTASEVGVQARLQINSAGVEGQLDRNVLDRITAPIEHILRNSVVHGLEPPERRRREGKPAQGLINIEVTRDATDLVLEIEDDGSGIDPQALRESARAAGLVRPGDEPDDRTVLQYIFHSGLSTAESVTELAGRGVGLDVVSNNVRQLGGSVAVESEPGRGTRLTIRIPLTLAVMQAILVQAGERTFAIPLNAVSGVSKIDVGECRERLADGTPSLEYGGREYALMDLARLLGIDAALPETGTVSLLMVESGGLRAALLVTGLLQHDEFVVKPVGPQIGSIPGILAGTVTGDGSVVVILDIGPLLREAQAAAPAPAIGTWRPTRSQDAQGQRRKPVVLVVDDSITIRKVTARVLEQSGMEALTAKDGLDALEVMQQTRPDAILLDIEMPRMDGYELATHIRNDKQLQDIPIMIISSRTGEKHRERAREYDINDYLGKPYQEEDLLQRLRVLLGQAPQSSEV